MKIFEPKPPPTSGAITRNLCSGAMPTKAAITSRATLHPRDHDTNFDRNWLGKLGIPASALPDISLRAIRAARYLEGL